MKTRFVLSLLAVLLAAPSLVPAQNPPPVSNAGSDSSTYMGDCIKLQAPAYDPDGGPIVFWSWLVEGAPAGAVWYLVTPDMQAAVFYAHTPGQYLISSLGLAGCPSITKRVSRTGGVK